jgi:hypothetical protein
MKVNVLGVEPEDIDAIAEILGFHHTLADTKQDFVENHLENILRDTLHFAKTRTEIINFEKQIHKRVSEEIEVKYPRKEKREKQ